MAGVPLSTKARARAIAHRWGPVCALGPGGPSAGAVPELAALGIRYDEEDDGAGETFLLKLGPGRAELVDQLPGTATALAASTAGALFVLDDRGVVHVGGRRHKLFSAQAIARLGDGVVLAAGDRLWSFGPDGAKAEPGPPIRARRLASSKAGLLAATDDGRVLFSTGGEGQEVTVLPGGQMAALAIDDEGRVAAASGRTVLVGDTREIKTVASAPFEIHCVAIHQGKTLLSSRAHGLFCIEDGRVMPLKPSLRAHTLMVHGDVLIAASDLFLATSDGETFMTRDLAPFVRLAEQRLPRFLHPDDSHAV